MNCTDRFVPKIGVIQIIKPVDLVLFVIELLAHRNGE